MNVHILQSIPIDEWAASNIRSSVPVLWGAADPADRDATDTQERSNGEAQGCSGGLDEVRTQRVGDSGAGEWSDLVYAINCVEIEGVAA